MLIAQISEVCLAHPCIAELDLNPVIAGATVLVTSLALAANAAPTLSSAGNSTLHKTVVIEGHGRTVYTLSSENTHHLLCRSGACFAAWPPVTIR